MNVVGICWNGSYFKTGGIPFLFIEIERLLDHIPYKINEGTIITPFHNRETEFTYYVTTEVEKIGELPEGLVGFTIPGKNYVCTTHIGKADEVETTYNHLFKWMDDYGYEQDYKALSLEIYQKDNNKPIDNGELYFDIYIPVKKY